MTYYVVGNSTIRAFVNLGRSAAGGSGKYRWQALVGFTVDSPGLEVVLQSYSRELVWQHGQHPPSSSSPVQEHRRFVRVSVQ